MTAALPAEREIRLVGEVQAFSEDLVTYANCPECGLSIIVRTGWLIPRCCPRCLAHRRTAVAMLESKLPYRTLIADAERPPAPPSG
jgi:hypothetical protein